MSWEVKSWSPDKHGLTPEVMSTHWISSSTLCRVPGELEKQVHACYVGSVLRELEITLMHVKGFGSKARYWSIKSRKKYYRVVWNFKAIRLRPGTRESLIEIKRTEIVTETYKVFIRCKPYYEHIFLMHLTLTLLPWGYSCSYSAYEETKMHRS